MNQSLEYTCTKDTAVVYKLRVKNGGISEWANISIREWPNGGSIDIQSSFGRFSSSWPAIGEGQFRTFLCRLNDMGYFFQKCLGNAYLEFDCEATIREIKSDIIRDRRYASIEHSVAREIWDSLRDVDANNASAMLVEMGEDAFDYMVGELYDHDRSLLPIMNRPNGQCVDFWERI